MSLAPRVGSRVVIVAPGHPRPYDESEWRDALVVVAWGQIELESVGGDRRRFGRGAVLWLQALPLRAISSHGDEPAVLVAFSRRAAGSDAARKGEILGPVRPRAPDVQ